MQILVLGANSDIGFAVARKFAGAEHTSLCLASRDMGLLGKKAKDLEIRYQVKCKCVFFDAVDYSSHAQFYNGLSPKPDGVVLAFGYLGEQKKAQADFIEARRIIETNYLGAVSILEVIAADFERRGHGFIIGLSSVAGERGRQSNYIYGSAKAGLTAYLSGLRNRLYRRNVKVMTVLAGFVRTKMTDGLDLPDRLVATPEEIAEDIHKSYLRGKDRIYSPWFWKWIMAIIKLIPETIFKRMNI